MHLLLGEMNLVLLETLFTFGENSHLSNTPIRLCFFWHFPLPQIVSVAPEGMVCFLDGFLGVSYSGTLRFAQVHLSPNSNLYEFCRHLQNKLNLDQTMRPMTPREEGRYADSVFAKRIRI